MGAGILPTSIVNGKLYFLFGKENKYADTPGWSDFGGGTDNNESFMETALREGSEELTGYLGDKQDLKNILSKGTYIIQNDEKYKMYLFALEYDPNLPYYYNNNYKFLDKKLDPTIIKKSKIFEKSEIRWICIDDLIKMKNQFRTYFQNKIYIILKDKKKIYDFIQKRMPQSQLSKTKYSKNVKNTKTRKNKTI